MAKATTQPCPSCGHPAPLPLASSTCASCGARLDTGRARRADGGLNLQAVGVGVAVQAMLTGAILFGLPILVPLFDFEGRAGMHLAIPVWLVGGVVVGLVSAPPAHREVALASALVAVPAAWLLFRGQTVKTMPWFLYAMLSAVGVMFAFVGTHLGERLQSGPARRSPSA